MFHLFLSSQVESCFRQHLGSRLVSACAGWPEWASADSQLAGEGGREERIILRIRGDNVGRLLICCVADKVMMMTRLASSSHQSTEAGCAERMRLCWRTLCPLLATGGRGLRLCGLGSPSGGWWEEDATNTDLLPPPPARLVAHCKVHTNICHIGSNITKCSDATTRWPQNLQLIQISYAAHSNLIRFSYKILIFDTGRSSALSLPSNPDGKSRWVRPEQESVPDITAGCQLTISILMWAMW